MSFNFNRSNIDHYLYLIAKEYKKANRNNPEAEIILVGGASMIINYSFRENTTDLDSIIRASSNMKSIINKIGDDNGLASGLLEFINMIILIWLVLLKKTWRWVNKLVFTY